MVKTEDKRRIAVIGVGGWGKNHARVLHEMGVSGQYVMRTNCVQENWPGFMRQRLISRSSNCLKMNSI